MILLFEGAEHVGKSSLAKKCVNYGFTYYRSTHQKDRKTDLELAISHDWRFFLDIYLQSNFNIIFDRSFISQYVYSILFRKDNVLKYFNTIEKYENLFREYCDLLSKSQHLIIYCTRKNYEEKDEDDYIDLKYSDQIKEKFNFFFEKIGYYLDITECKFEDGIEYNLNKIYKRLLCE